MAAVKVKNVWTAFISLLVALLASLGFAPAASAAQQQAVRQPEEPAAQKRPRSAAAGYGTSQGVVRPRASRDRSLPPTIKQRIGAEAHGASPAVRHLPAEPDLAAAMEGLSPVAYAEPATATA
ncbi:DUF6344 domain-containing protein [Streptomyces sp. NPDC057445]|uniref:DUF6344 domain-containing protein n=1 Tax=Streptomyces sp. NPDC057445 TaxID=3346136 RepID=UPI0036A67413